MLNSYVIWFLDGRYSLAWGTNEADAKSRYLANWERGIAKVESTATYQDPLPQHLYVATPGARWDDEEVPISIHQPIIHTSLTEQIAAQVATQLAEALKHAKN